MRSNSITGDLVGQGKCRSGQDRLSRPISSSRRTRKTTCPNATSRHNLGSHDPGWCALLVLAGFVFATLPRASGNEVLESRNRSWDAVRPLEVVTLSDGSRIARGEILVGLASWDDRDALLANVSGRGAKLLGQLPHLRVVRLDVPSGQEEAWIDSVHALPGVAYAEPNGIGEVGGSTTLPGDPFLSSQWQLNNSGQGGGTPGADIDAFGAWEIQTGSAAVKVAILDTGIDATNPEFAGRLLPGFDSIDEDNDPAFVNDHGIFVAGLLAGNADNGFAGAGVDHHCKIIPVRVVDFVGTVFDLVQGIDFAVAQGADIISMSLVNYPPSPAITNSLEAARAAGVILVACGGNAGINNADVSYPGASPDTISIGWTDKNDVRANLSGTGNALDFVAPGDAVVTQDPSGSNSVVTFSGCSAATPIAAGIVALLKAQYPPLTQEQAYDVLIAGAEDQVGPAAQDTPGKDVFYGHGRLNALKSLRALCACTGDESLIASPQQLPLSIGGAQYLQIDVGSASAGSTYWILGSVSGVAPGIPLGGAHLPLNYDIYTDLLVAFPNSVVVPSLTTVDAAGEATAILTVPQHAPASLVGLTIHHAFLLFNGAPSLGTLQLASNAVPLQLIP